MHSRAEYVAEAVAMAEDDIERAGIVEEAHSSVRLTLLQPSPYSDRTPTRPGPRPAVDAAWTTLDPERLMQTPPPRRWLLRHPTRDGLQCAPGDGDGLLPLGKAGVITADGGIGKTMALCDLAVCVVTGHPWLGHFHVDHGARGGRVLLGLAEEDEEEIYRRLHGVCRSRRLAAEEWRLVAERVVALPLAGQPVALVTFAADGRTRVDSPELDALRRRLAAHDRWSLVGLDPIARWGDDDTEKDNAAATRVMQAVESLTAAPGNPTVLAAHHASLQGVQTGQIRSRGVTGLRNAARWEATMRAEKGDVYWVQAKSNYSRPMMEELRLVRGEGGLLRVATAAEVAERESRVEDKQTEQERAKQGRYRAQLDDHMAAILAAASVEPKSVRQLAAAVGIHVREATPAVLRAVQQGRLCAGQPERGHDRYWRGQ